MSEYKALESMGIWTVYNDTEVDWFDSETASSIADYGKRLSYSIISYWIGLQMEIEQLEEKNKPKVDELIKN